MRPLYKGLILGVVHLLIVASLGAKLLYDRSTRPRVWARAAPCDPSLPIRGRYVSLQLEVQAQGIAPPAGRDEISGPGANWWRRTPVILYVENDQLVARHDSDTGPDDYGAWGRDAVILRRQADGTALAVLADPVLFFIPEHVPDPSVRKPGEELWVEVTLPRKGPPRPIRLGVKREGVLTPLDLD
ncbi:MAG: hypothetical protein ACRD5W_09485 [Candidatus Acidiferrales bacterium]